MDLKHLRTGSLKQNWVPSAGSDMTKMKDSLVENTRVREALNELVKSALGL